MEIEAVLEKIRRTESPLKRQLLVVGLISKLLEERGKPAPVLIGGGALSYYTREAYFTANIDLAYADREALDGVLGELGFSKRGRYWLNGDLDIPIEVPVGVLSGESAPVEIAELESGLTCTVLGVEDLIVDRLSFCKHWKYQIDCEMAELLVRRYAADIDWVYLEGRAAGPENDTGAELAALKAKYASGKKS
jgi:hypothetical protein